MTKLFTFLSFLLPFQLSIHFNKFAPLVFGFSIDYLIPAIFITDIVVLLLIIYWFIKKRPKFGKFSKRRIVITAGIISFVIINTATSTHLVPTVFKWFKFLELFLLAMIIKSNKEIKVFDHFIKPLSFSVFIVCLLAISQFINKGSLGGAFYLLGERALRFSSPGISPHPYSTFSHPNSLAGFLFVFSVFLLYFKSKFSDVFSKNFFYLLLSLIVCVLFLVNSLNVFVSALLLFFVFKFKVNKRKVVAFLLVATIATLYIKSGRVVTSSVVARIKLANASVEIFKTSPLFGVGLNNFIPKLVSTNIGFENSWQLQPVHNNFLLVLAETGVLGLFGVLAYLFSPYLTFFVLPILFTGTFDHYWLTLQQNMLLLTMIIGFTFGNIKQWRKI
ncbi:O-antigen ligase family protein [Candidatus Microgenomates bacterium]|nr:O-antigen ligase family protein [Candidatus Microgenomates bacterium]